MKRLIVLFLFFLLSVSAMAQMSIKDRMTMVAERYGVSFVYDPSLPVNLPSASVDLKNGRLEDALTSLFKGTGILWERSGKYIVLKQEKHKRLSDSQSEQFEAEIQMDTLIPSIITSRKDIASTLDKLSVGIEDVRGIVSPLGEGDPIKWAQKLPGVASGADGTSAFYVRGGNMGNTLFSLDGVPIYGYSHLLGLTTIIPTAAMKSATLQRGGFDGADGNFTSAHLCVVSKAPEDGFKTSIALNNFLLSAESEGKLGNVSYVVSARISPLTLEYRTIKGCLPDILQGMKDFGATVGDVYGKIRWQMSNRSWMEFSGMGSLDQYSFSLESDSYEYMSWSNALGIIKFHTNSANSSFEATAYVNKYGSEQVQDKRFRGNDNHMSLRSDLFEVSLSFDRNRKAGRFVFDYGAKMRYAQFAPGQVAAINNRADTFLGDIYAQAKYVLPEKLEVKLSTRANFYKNLSNEGANFDPEYSFCTKWQIGDHLAIEGSFDRLVQYYHTLEGLPIGWSLDMIVPSGNNVKPESTLQSNLGFSFKAEGHNAAIGGFYKKMDNLVYYRYAQELFSGGMADWENNVNQGKGKSFGVELLYEYHHEDWYANASYTISKTNRYGFSEINGGGEFHAKFDRTHILNILGKWKGLSLAFTLQSGQWEDGAAATYPMHVLGGDKWTARYYSGVNNYHMPMLVRLDLGYKNSFETGKCKHEISLGVCNVTNHFNPFMLYYDSKSESWKELSLLPILPNFSYQIVF